ncbi:MAG: VOC family protein [Planctomycetota bacterium]
MNDQSLNVQPIDHITLVVADLDATRDFYVNLLGMEEVPRPAFGFPGAWFQSGATQIHATVSDEDSGQAGWADRNVGKISRGHHFAFQVDDAVAAAEFLKERGIEIKDGPKHRPDGPTQIYFHDPDGHLVELFSM